MVSSSYTSFFTATRAVWSFLFALARGGLWLPRIGSDTTFGSVRRSNRKAVLLLQSRIIANRAESTIFLMVGGPLGDDGISC